MEYFLGLDLGQAADCTALVIAERLPTKPKRSFHLRHIQRFKLGTPYPTIVNEVKALTETKDLKGQCTLVIDQTGCGRPEYDLFVTARLSCPLSGVSIHGGDNTTREGRQWRVPKRNLVTTIQVLLQEQRLKIADVLPEALILLKELLNFCQKIDPLTAHDSYSAWREGGHDDLVLAKALACWITDHQLHVQSTSR
jgi:hypothetical protein